MDVESTAMMLSRSAVILLHSRTHTRVPRLLQHRCCLLPNRVRTTPFPPPPSQANSCKHFTAKTPGIVEQQSSWSACGA
uniref:Uncharacterized protein n=1 Tax=Oryza sativa subsp. japonica TaxID=39947 RepID=Q5Z881_ORYSJ|nr:hypothetical protein [Oryza sativa Japonica Group]BAD53975.1 hypothetical protein [Oryza sativa Japonica Group]